MEKHQLSTMIAGLSLLAAIISVIVPAYAGVSDKDRKDLCEDNGGEYTSMGCELDDESPGVDTYGKDLSELQRFEEERAADEDALCDDPDANFDICNPTGRDDKDKDDNDDNKFDLKQGGSDDEYNAFKFKDGENEVTAYYRDEDDAEEAYENLDRDELTHGDKSFNDWEYDDEEHPALNEKNDDDDDKVKVINN